MPIFYFLFFNCVAKYLLLKHKNFWKGIPPSSPPHPASYATEDRLHQHVTKNLQCLLLT
jgi:hypothetical protein